MLVDRLSLSIALFALAALTLTLVAIGPRLRIRADFDELSRTEIQPTFCVHCDCALPLSLAGQCGCSH